MDKSLLLEIRKEEKIYNYLRLNPKWYRLLDENVNNYKEFMENYKKDYKLLPQDKFNDFTKQFNFIVSMINYIRYSR